jgi:hypothetical protein
MIIKIIEDASKKTKLERDLKLPEGWKEVTGKRSARRNLQLDEKEKESIEEIDYAEVDIQENGSKLNQSWIAVKQGRSVCILHQGKQCNYTDNWYTC